MWIMVVWVVVVMRMMTIQIFTLQFRRALATIKRFLYLTDAFIYPGRHIFLIVSRFIPTGAKSIDCLLGGGVRIGMLTDIYGAAGSGKTQLCFTLCVNFATYFKDKGKIVFIDTSGKFRPERINEIGKVGGKNNYEILDNIIVIRSLSTYDQINVVKNIYRACPGLVIIDSATSLFSDEFKGSSRHLVLMKHLHDLSIAAISFDCAVVITNMIRNVPVNRTTYSHIKYKESKSRWNPNDNGFEEREFMNASVSIYAHIKLKLAVDSIEQSAFTAGLIQPARKNKVKFGITANGISDL
jgi:hypothetical protein